MLTNLLTYFDTQFCSSYRWDKILDQSSEAPRSFDLLMWHSKKFTLSKHWYRCRSTSLRSNIIDWHYFDSHLWHFYTWIIFYVINLCCFSLTSLTYAHMHHIAFILLSSLFSEFLSCCGHEQRYIFVAYVERLHSKAKLFS